MNTNPFTPSFGGKPQYFFGRNSELSLIGEALSNELSPHRALFITGNRGCGKTALLEQASRMAEACGWMAIDVHAEDALLSTVHKLAGGQEVSHARNLQPEAFGVSAGSLSKTFSTHYTGMDLADLMQEKLEDPIGPKGILVTVDEVQKISEKDAEGLCAGFQMSLRKGCAVMLVMAGLPGSKENVASFPGCTFMTRAFDVKLGSLFVSETYEALKKLVASVRGLSADEEAIKGMARFSLGYPYLMQLIGYYSVEQARENDAKKLMVTAGDVALAAPMAYERYRDNVLGPALAPVKNGTTVYLEAMASVMDEGGTASTSRIAQALGKTLAECSTTRQRLIDRRLVVSGGHGLLRFNLPYLRQYLQEREIIDEADGLTPDTWVY